MRTYLRSASVLVLALFMLASIPGMSLANTTYYPPAGTWNGYKVYLSPAYHVPDNVGCDNYQESAGASNIANAAKNTLLSYGYQVRIGSGDYQANTTDSNAWGSSVHVPIHSNAGTWDCTGQNSANGGTWLIYADTADYNVGVKVLDSMRSYSPGTTDQICSDTSGCTAFTLHELRSTNMPAAYVEAAFHTYGPDEDWLLQYATVGERIAVGIDQYFGSPRCPSPDNPCPEGIDPGVEVMSESHPTQTAEITLPSGTEFAELRSALSHLLAGSPEAGRSVFSQRTSGKLGDVRLVDGVAVVDFQDLRGHIPNASTSFVRARLYVELNSVVFKFPEVKSVLYRMNGSCQTFASWLETECKLISRGEWESFQPLKPN